MTTPTSTSPTPQMPFQLTVRAETQEQVAVTTPGRPVIRAQANSSGGTGKGVIFDATVYFEQMDATAIDELAYEDFGPGQASDAVAAFMANSCPALHDLIHSEDARGNGCVCVISERDAWTWISAHHPNWRDNGTH